MGLTETLAQQRQAAFDEINKAEEAKAFYLFYKKNPTIYPCQANDNVFRRYIDPMPVTVQSLELAIDAVKGELAWSNPEASKSVLAKQDAAQAEEKAQEIAENNARLRGLSKDQLRGILRESKPVQPKAVVSKTRAEILAMSAAELRSLLLFSNGQARPGVREAVDEILKGGN